MTDEVVKTSRLELTDKNGRTRAVLTCDDRSGAPTLAFLDAAGVTRAVLGISWNDMPQVQLNADDGTARVALVARPEGTGMIVVSDGSESKTIAATD